MPLSLNYYYGNEAEQYSFYRVPKETDLSIYPARAEPPVDKRSREKVRTDKMDRMDSYRELIKGAETKLFFNSKMHN